MIRRPPRSTQSRSSAASDVYKRQGNIRFNRVGDAPIIGKLIEVYWKKSKIGDRDEEAETMRAALRRKLGGEAETPAEEELISEPPLDVEKEQPAEKNFFQWLFQDFLRIHVEDEHIITYRKHWLCLLYTSPSPRDRTRSRMPSSA